MSSPSSSARTTPTLQCSPPISATSSDECCIDAFRRPHNAWYCRHEGFPQFLAEHANATNSTIKEIQQFLQAGASNQIMLNNQGEVYNSSEIDFVVQVDVTTPPNQRGHRTERRCIFASVGNGDFYEISRQIWKGIHPQRDLLDDWCLCNWLDLCG